MEQKREARVYQTPEIVDYGTLVELTTVVRLGVDLVTVKAKVAAVDGV